MKPHRSTLAVSLALLAACSPHAPPPATDASLDAASLDDAAPPDSPLAPDASLDVAPPDAPPPPDAPAVDCGSPSAATYTLSTERLTVSGAERTFMLASPLAPCGTLALVFVFHGDGGAAGRTQRFLHLEDTTLGRALVVYAEGLPAAGTTTTTWDADSPADRNRDVAYFDAMLSAVRARFTVDARRVFATGLSRGAMFVNNLGCVRGSVLRAIAPNSGGGPFAADGAPTERYEGVDLAVCPTPAVSAMVIHGADDTTVLPAEGQRSRLHWEHANGCTNTRASEAPAPCEASRNCRDGRRVLWCLVPGLGHLYWPAIRENAWGFFDSMR